MTTDNTQPELDEILREHRGRILTYEELYRKHHHNNHRRIVDFEHADAVIKQALLDWHNKQILEMLKDEQDDNERSVSAFKYMWRNKLKEGK